MAVITHGESLETAMHEVVSSWLTRTDPIPEPWKQTMSPIVAMPCDDVLALGTSSCRQFVSQSRCSLGRLQCLYETFNGLSFVFAEKFHVALENAHAVKNMCNLSTLPNELLVRIFEFVVFGDRTLQNRWRAAVPLSHVCRYFRDTILSCPVLWTDISGNAGIAALSLLRSKEAPLDFSFEIDTSGSSLDFSIPVRDALKHSKRWRTLVLRVVRKGSRYISNRRVPGILMTEVIRNFGAVDAPLLETLDILNSSGFALYEEKEGFSQWNTPNLRYLNTVCIPLTLRGLSNVTHLTLTLLLDHFSYNIFFKSLSHLKSLEVLVLKPMDAWRATEFQEFNKTELHVRRLSVEMHIGLSSIEFLRKLFASLSFPSAKVLEVKIEGEVTARYPEDDYDDGPTFLADKEMDCILQHGGQFPLVERFSLEAYGIIRNQSDLNALQTDDIYLPVPIAKLSSLKHLSLSSNGRVHLSIPDPNCSWKNLLIEVPATFNLPMLETISITILTFAPPRWFASFTKNILRQQRERGGWGKFRKLVVTADDRLTKREGRRTTATYIGDDAWAWCERHEKLVREFYPGAAAITD
ncbi:hypothetical protein SCHPADRAFT_995936 [Schizopora paradoxa]|uniref:F-box domain-containing protein n=1 Tax=Schizopora paradoxa TaxID=27342 RepID=A0A0H2RTY4_9AGAM|nr:hypothetical protein SCHPADRAFT_995936 [Schizopora paradoxa]